MGITIKKKLNKYRCGIRKKKRQQKEHMKILEKLNLRFEFISKRKDVLRIHDEVASVFSHAFVEILYDTLDEVTEEVKKSRIEQHEKVWKDSKLGLTISNQSRYFCIWKKDIPVAFLLFKIKSRSAFISYIAVLPEYQQNGIGKLLVYALFEKFGQLEYVRLNPVPDKRVLNFWKHIGFKRLPKCDNTLILHKKNL